MTEPEDSHEYTTLQAIFEAQRDEDECERKVLMLKEELKEAKELWIDARDRRVALVRHSDQRRLAMGEVA